MGLTETRYDILATIIFFLLAIFFEYSEAFSLIEDETLSYRQLIRTYYGAEEFTRPLDEKIVIVFTDEAFYDEYDKFPLKRTDLSTIIDRLAQMGAAVIVVDMLLDFNSAYGEDLTLEIALQDAANVLMVSQAQLEGDDFIGINKAIPRFDDLTTSGYSNISPNSVISERIVRLKMYPQIAEEAGEWPVSVRAVANYLDIDTDDISLIGNVLKMGDQIKLNLDQFNDLYIDYPRLPPDGAGGTAKLHEVVGMSASDILFVEDEEELEDLAFLVEGRIVLIGEVAEVAHDEFETPVGNVFGVEIVANTIATILKNGPLQAAPFLVEAIIALLMMIALIGTRAITNPLPRNSVSVGLLILYIFITVFIYVDSGYILSMSYVLLASVIAIILINSRYYLAEMNGKALIRDMFGQYLSPTVVADLVKDPAKLSLGGEEREMTAFFSDIAGFSTISENMSPSELVNVLNDYLTEMCNIIISTEGTIDKFEGDAIIAFWGAPAIQKEHAKLACFAAIDMNKKLVELRSKWAKEGGPAINVRMGLNSGSMVVGNMGSAQRMDYTIMGDAVNLAARLEGANKAYGSDLMISEATYLAVKDHVDVRELDIIRVVGKSEPIKVFQLLDQKGGTHGLEADLMAQFEKGLGLYRDGNYAEAKAAFKLSLAIVQDDGPSTTYIERCGQFIESPPPANWDGVFTLDSKG